MDTPGLVDSRHPPATAPGDVRNVGDQLGVVARQLTICSKELFSNPTRS